MKKSVWLGLLFLLVSCREHRIVTDSMEPTLKNGETIKANYSAYVSGNGPQRWDIVAFENNVNGTLWVHRVVGLPEETITIADSAIWINGKLQPLPATMSGVNYVTETGYPMKVTFPYTIPKDYYFLLGDNSMNALDSRFHGAVHRDRILARVEDK